jgi:clan AA aspartic protease, TIGR02281 family
MSYGFIFLSIIMLMPISATADMFRCIDRAGRTVFTDSPSQLDQCAPVAKHSALPTPVLPPATHEADRTTPISPGGDSRLVIVTGDGALAIGGGVTVPVTRVGRSLVVQVRINGLREAHLIVDTGADITVLSSDIARDLGLNGNGRGSSMTLNTVGGAVRADVVRVESLGVGAAEVKNVAVAVHDLPEAQAGVDGLLGLTFLDKFLVTLDAQKGELLLRQREVP